MPILKIITMSSLAATTEKMRSLLKIGGLIGVILFGLYLFISGGILVKNIFFPNAPTAPVQGFGQLPEIVFEQKSSPAIDYKINTLTGELPTNLPSKMFVYKLLQPKPDLLALQNSKNLATIAGFKEGEIKISSTEYRWTNPGTNSTITIDINNKNFEINSNLALNQSIISNSLIPEEERIKQHISNYLQSLGVDLEKLSFREESLVYYTFSNNILTKTDNSFTAKAIRVNLYNKNIENEQGNFAFVYPNPEFPLVTLLVAFPSSSRMIVLEGKSYNKIVTDESSDYPVKSPTVALDELKSGKGYLHNPNNLNTVEITDVYLSYYLDENTNEYALPVYVFEGINSRGFVTAVQFATTSAEVTSE